MRFTFNGTNPQVELVKFLDPIKHMLKETWNLSHQFSLPENGLLGPAIHLFNLYFSTLNNVMTAILKSVVALAALAPDLFHLSKTFQKKCEVQEKDISAISQASINMSRRIEKISENTNHVAEDATCMENEVQTAMLMGEKSMAQILEIKSVVDALVDVIHVLDDNSRSIGSIIDAINDIADESSLLSLNAKIEAARSGEYGKGFAVIAKEVAELADQSKQATTDIQSKLTVIREKVSETVTAVERVDKNVQTGESVIKASNRSLTQVSNRFAPLSKSIHEIKTTIDSQYSDIKAVAEDISSLEAAVKFLTNESQTIFNIAHKINKSCDQAIVDTGIFHLSNHQKAKTIAQTIAGLPEMRSNDRNRLEKVMHAALIQHPFIELIYLTDNNGVQVTSNIYAEKLSNAHNKTEGFNCNWADKEWFSNAKRTGRTHVTQVYRSSATGGFCFTVAVPIFVGNETMRGVLGVDINFEDILKI